MLSNISYFHIMRNVIIFLIVVGIISILACTSKKQEGVFITDDVLFNLVKSSTSFTYYKNNIDTLLADPATNGAHGNYVRIRFNQKAISALNDSVSSPIKIFFPNESLIVKEIYDQSGSALLVLAVMYKFSGSANSGSGWVWAEYLPNGTAAYSSINKGGQCVSCHARGNNFDLVQTFLYH